MIRMYLRRRTAKRSYEDKGEILNKYNRGQKTMAQWLCSVCGYVVVGLEALDVCSVCNHPQACFEVRK